MIVGNIEYTHPTKAMRHIRKLLDGAREKNLLREWDERTIFSAFRHANIDKKLPGLWLEKKFMSARNFRNGISAQEQCLYTRVNVSKRDAGNVMKGASNPACT